MVAEDVHEGEETNGQGVKRCFDERSMRNLIIAPSVRRRKIEENRQSNHGLVSFDIRGYFRQQLLCGFDRPKY